MSFRRKKIFEVGGFDEAFYGMAIGEEVDLCYRLRAAGGRICYAPEAELIHFVNPSGGCRDAKREAELIAQLLDNASYMMRRTNVKWYTHLWTLFIQCKTIILNRQSIAGWKWPSKLKFCGYGCYRVLKGLERTPVHPLSMQNYVMDSGCD